MATKRANISLLPISAVALLKIIQKLYSEKLVIMVLFPI